MLGFLSLSLGRLEALRLLRPAVADRATTRRIWAALALLALLVTLIGARSFGLQDNNEGLYAEVAREMLAGGDWVIPHLNGGPYLEKPPLLYWALAGSMKVLGVNEVAVRLVPALFLLGTLGAVAWMGRLARREGRAQAVCLLLVSAGGFAVMGRSLLFDVPMMCWLAWAAAAFFAWRLSARRRWLWLFYGFLAAAVLTKGLIGIVFGGGLAVVSTAWLDRDLRAIARLFDPVGLLVFLVIAVPWHVLAAARQPDFLDFYFVNEHVRRFLDLREPKDYYTGPLYYYLARLPLYVGFWVVFLPLLLPWPARAGRRRPNATTAGATRDLRAILWIWLILPLVFFSISRAKANYYLLSAIPALAFLVVLGWPVGGERLGRRRVVAGSTVLFLLGLALPFAVLAVARLKPAFRLDLAAARNVLVPVLAALLVLAFTAWVCALNRRYRAVFVVAAGMGVVPWLAAPDLLGRADQALSQQDLVRYLQTEMPDAVVVSYRDYEKISSLAFYWRGPIAILGSRSDDLLYQQRHGYNPQLFLDEDAFHRLVARRRVAVVARPCHVPQLLARNRDLHLRVVRAFRSAVVLTAEAALASGPVRDGSP